MNCCVEDLPTGVNHLNYYIMAKQILKVGDEVVWKGSFGIDASKYTTVECIEINCKNKDGDEVDSIDWSKVNGRDVIVNLTNGHWAYGNQIKRKS
mgnify:CR=1 FL=1